MTTKPTVRESTDAFLGTKGGVTLSYRKSMETTFNEMCLKLGHLKVSSLREDHFVEMFDRWHGKLMPGTINCRRVHLKQWLTFAHARRQTNLHPEGVFSTIRNVRVVPRQRVYLNPNQMLGLLDETSHPRDRIFIALAIHTALRRSEIQQLRLEDVDLDAGHLYVLRIKTGTRDVLPLTADLESELRRWLTFYTQKVGKLSPKFYLVPAKKAPAPNRAGVTHEQQLAVPLAPEKPLDTTSSRRVIQQLLEPLGLPTDWEGMHTLRRSAARIAYDFFLMNAESRDEALSLTQALLGHSTQAMTEKYIGKERFREKRDKLLRGKPFLSAMIAETDNVRRLHVPPASGDGRM